MARSTLLAATVALLFLNGFVYAHEHHEDNIPEGAAVSPDPLDTILWIHILVQIVAWGLVFPMGMVLGLVRSRWHVPTQAFGTALAITGHFLGHKHHGRQFKHNVHSKFAPNLEWILFAQIVLGVLLKLHIERGILGRIRAVLVKVHKVVGIAIPILGWVQMLFGGITALGFCQGDHLGQCLAHFIMGSAFIAYGIILTIMLQVGQPWLRRTGRSQEFFDSIVIAAWGCVNTFTEHRWGGPWVRNDLQHTTMGIIWWAAGLVGIWLSRTRDGRPKRNLIPAIVIIMTGYGMSAHPQELMLSTMVHSFFGYTLMAAGGTRIIEVSFILRDRHAVAMDGDDASSFQYLPPFLLIASGFLFMGATEEQMALLSSAHVTHVSYILILFSFAFMLHLFVYILLHIYQTHTTPSPPPSYDGVDGAGPRARRKYEGDDEDPDADVEGGSHGANGHVPAGRALSERERRQVRDAQEFELETLISDDDDDEDGEERRRGDEQRVPKEGQVVLK